MKTAVTSSKAIAGKNCVVTGASDGIGYVAARELARMGARVLMLGRNAAKCNNAVITVQQETGNPKVESLLADMSSPAEVRRVAREIAQLCPELHVLLNNAGASFTRRQDSADGLEMTFALNHLGYYSLTNLLLEQLMRAAPNARVVNVSSAWHHGVHDLQINQLPNPPRYQGMMAYRRSKLCNLLFTYELARRLDGSGITVNALHPGLVRTNFMSNNGFIGRIANLFMALRGISSSKGAEASIYLASSPEVETVNGAYFIAKRQTHSSSESYDLALASDLWELSAQLTGIPGSDAFEAANQSN